MVIWFGDKDKTLNYSPKSGDMILTVHRWFANKSCPGNWMYARMGDLADSKTQKGAYKILDNAKKCADQNPGYSVFDVNGVNIYTPKTTTSAASVDVPFLVRITITDLNIRKGPGTEYDRTQFIPVGVYTIVEIKSGKGSTTG